jgi:hypothetical protein
MMAATDAAVALALFASFSLPGWILAGRGQPLWIYIAAGFASQAFIALLFAIIASIIPGGCPLLWLLPLTALFASAVWISRRPAGSSQSTADFETWSIVVSVVATLCAAAIFRFAIFEDRGDLVVHAFFNADGFKHLGLVQSLSRFGAPAQDIYGYGDHLAYYWLFYLIPATGAAIHGHAFGALVAASLVQTFAFWILVFGLIRQAGASPRLAAMLALIAWVSPSLDGISALADHGWNVWDAIHDANVEAYNERMVSASGLFRLGLYIPQHQFMLAGFLSWGLLHAAISPGSNGRLRLLSFAPLLAAAALSTLLGLVCMAIFSLTMLFDGRMAMKRRLAVIAMTGIGALAIGLFLGIVSLKSGNSGIASPLFSDPNQVGGPLVRLLLVAPGVVLAYGVSLLGLIGLLRWHRTPKSDEAPFRTFVTAMTLGGLAIMALLSLVDAPRLVQEAQMRASLLPAIGMAIAAAHLFAPTGLPRRLPFILSLTALPLLGAGLLTPAIDIGWHTRPDGRWVTRIPGDDRALLSWMNNNIASGAVVLQYPEPPVLGGGKGLWVPLIAGRTIYSSHRATNWPRHAPMLERAREWFERGGEAPPGVTHIYLSRALTPDVYDDRFAELENSADWQPLKCFGQACLFDRRPGTVRKAPPSQHPPGD